MTLPSEVSLEAGRIVMLCASHGVEAVPHPAGYVLATQWVHHPACGWFEEVSRLPTVEATFIWLGY